MSINTAKHKKLILAAGIAICGFWVFLFANLLSGSNSTQVIHQPGTTAVQTTTSVAKPYAPVSSYSAPTNILHHETTVSMTPTIATHSTAASTSTALHAYQTSRATMHSIGGGGNGGGSVTSYGSSSSAKGVNYTPTTYSGAIYIPSNHNSITEVGAGSAKVIAKTVTTESNNAPAGPRKLPGHEEEWWLTPIGDALLPLALLALGYFGYRVIRRKREA